MTDLVFFTPDTFSDGLPPEQRLSPQAVRQKIKRGEIHAQRAGTTWIITPEERERFLRSWASKRRGNAARWASYREFTATMIKAEAEVA